MVESLTGRAELQPHTLSDQAVGTLFKVVVNCLDSTANLILHNIIRPAMKKKWELHQ